MSSPNAAPLGPIDEPLTLRRFLFQAFGLGALMFASLGLYLVVLKWRGYEGAERITWLAWDDYVPFQPAWVWAYLIPYLVGPALVGLLRRETFNWFVPRAVAVVLMSLTFFVALPTQTKARPPLTLEDGPTRVLYAWMVEVDEPPANAAPSLHVSLTCLLLLALLRDFGRLWPVWVSGTLVVWAATLFTRQHHIMDVVTGAALCLGVVWLWPLKKGIHEGTRRGTKEEKGE